MRPYFYEVLRIEMAASQAEIRQAFRRLAREYHPDLNRQNDTATDDRFIEIAKAYEVLGDAERRREYDGSSGLPTTLPPPPAGATDIDPYAVLGLEPGASPDEVRTAFRRLNLELKPQARRGADEARQRLDEALEAYRILGDPERRRHYDLRSRTAA